MFENFIQKTGEWFLQLDSMSAAQIENWARRARFLSLKEAFCASPS